LTCQDALGGDLVEWAVEVGIVRDAATTWQLHFKSKDRQPVSN